jgi:hypothetical protein
MAGQTGNGSPTANSGTPPTNGGGAPGTGQWGNDRWRLGIWAVFAGLACLLGIFALVAFKWRSDQGVAALGAVASPIVAIVSAYFGIQATQNASTQAAKAHEQAGEARAEATRATMESAQSHEQAKAAHDAGMRLATRLRDEEADASAQPPSEASGQGVGAEHPSASPAEPPPSRRAIDLARDLFPEAFGEER